MKERVLHLHIEQTTSVLERAKAAWKRAAAGSTSKDVEHLSFATFDMFNAAFTPKRWTLLRVLNASGPLSIRALSKDLERDYKSVHGDVAKLMELGLIVKREDGKIEAPYDRIVSDIRMAAA